MELPSFSVVMAYHNRLEQTLDTLRRFNVLYAGKYDFEVIIVDDGSRPDQDLGPYIGEDPTEFQFNILLIRIEPEKKRWINPVVPYNLGFYLASKDILFIQNPEIYHCDDLFGYYAENCRNDHYYTFPVFSSPTFEHNQKLISANYPNGVEIFREFIEKIDYREYGFDYEYYREKYPELTYVPPEHAENHWLFFGINEGRTCNKSGIFYRKNVIHEWKGWYNHAIYNKRDLHFLTAISRKTFQEKIGGFDLAFKDGLWYDDNDLIDRIAKVLPVETILSDQFMGIHQFHTSGSNDHHKRVDFERIVEKNRNIYDINKAGSAADSFKPNNVFECVTDYGMIRRIFS